MGMQKSIVFGLILDGITSDDIDATPEQTLVLHGVETDGFMVGEEFFDFAGEAWEPPQTQMTLAAVTFGCMEDVGYILPSPPPQAKTVSELAAKVWPQCKPRWGVFHVYS